MNLFQDDWKDIFQKTHENLKNSIEWIRAHAFLKNLVKLLIWILSLSFTSWIAYQVYLWKKNAFGR